MASRDSLFVEITPEMVLHTKRRRLG